MKKFGIIALVAVMFLASCGKVGQGIIGKVVDEIFGDPVTTVDITIVAYDNQNPQAYKVRADKNGEFQLQLDPGNYRIEFEDNTQDFAYARKIEALKVEKDKAEEITYKLDPIVKQWIHGIVINKETKKPIADAEIAFDDAIAKTNKKGEFELRNYRPGIKHLKITAKGYAPVVRDYRMSAGETSEDFEMSPADSIEGATVKPFTDLVSFVLDVSIGKSQDDAAFYAITENNFPYGVMVESSKSTYMMVMEKYFKKTGEKFEKATKEEFVTSIEDSYTNPKALLLEAFKQFNSLKKEMSTNVKKLESGNLVSYNFTVNFDNINYACELELYFDGIFRGFMNKIVLTAPGKYVQVFLKDINLPKNMLKQPEGL